MDKLGSMVCPFVSSSSYPIVINHNICMLFSQFRTLIVISIISYFDCYYLCYCSTGMSIGTYVLNSEITD